MSRSACTTAVLASALLLAGGQALGQTAPAPGSPHASGAEAGPGAEGVAGEAAPSPAKASSTGRQGTPGQMTHRPPAEPSPALEPEPWQASAGADAPPQPAELGPADGPEPLGSHQQHAMVILGLRSSYIRNAGYDPFSENDSLVQMSLGGGMAFLSFGDVSVAAMGLWEYGASSHEARGELTDLDVHRLSLGPEVRYHLFFWLYGFGRLSFAALNTRASLQESVVDTTLYSRQWSFGFDASVGAAFQLYGKRSGASRKPRIWAIAEGGYGWASERDLRFVPEDDDTTAPQRLEATPLGSLGIRGPMFRLSAALTF